MRDLLAFAALLALGAGPLAADGETPECETCGNETYGTTIDWAGSPSEAARIAADQEKLVFVLHVSGHFEDPAFT